jgi:hypothetical protein
MLLRRGRNIWPPTRDVYCTYCGNWVDRPNLVGLCWVCAKFEVPWRTQMWVWFTDLFRKERF